MREVYVAGHNVRKVLNFLNLNVYTNFMVIFSVMKLLGERCLEFSFSSFDSVIFIITLKQNK